MVQKLRVQVRKKEDLAKDLEEYIDSLLLRVMSNDPNLLLAQQASNEAASLLAQQTSCARQAGRANNFR